jgi:hypothetical protein
MRRWAKLGAAALLSGAASPGFAHHSVAGSYDSSHEATIEGRVVEFEFVNPHPILTIEAAVRGGEPRLWRLEMENRAVLGRGGIDAHTFNPEDYVVARGRGGRLSAHIMYVLQIDRPADGFRYEQDGTAAHVTFGKHD